MLQSAHDLTAAFPSDAQAAASCATPTPSASPARGAGGGSGTCVPLLLVAAQQRGQDALLDAPSLPGQLLFLQDIFQHCTPDFRWNFAAMLPFWQWGFVSPPSVSATANCPESLKRNC